MSSTRWTDLAAAFVLDALEPSEREEFEARLRTDPELQATVDEFRETLGAVADDLPQVPPPEHLRGRVLSKASAAPHARSKLDTDDAPGPQAGDEPLSTDRGLVRSPLRGRLALAASVVLLIAASASALVLRNRTGELSRQVAALSVELETVRADLADADVALARYDSITATFLGADLRFASLSAPDLTPQLHLIVNRDAELLLVAAANLPPAPAGRIYQLWGLREGEDPVSMGLFNSGADNSALQVLALADASDFELSAVTEEPATGSPQPTTTPFLVGDWIGGDT